MEIKVALRASGAAFAIALAAPTAAHERGETVARHLRYLPAARIAAARSRSMSIRPSSAEAWACVEK